MDKVAVTVLFTHVFGILMTILALSLDSWQGNRLTVKEIYGTPSTENKILSNMFQNLKPDSVTKKDIQEKPGSMTQGFNKIAEKVMEEVPSEYDGASLSLEMGLWHLCIKDVEMPEFPVIVKLPRLCIDVLNDWVKGDVDTVSAMMFLGLFCFLGGLLVSVLRFSVTEERRIMLPLATGLDFFAGLFLLVGFSYYADALKLEIFSFQSAFYLCILGWLAAWVSGFVLVVTKIRSQKLDVV